MKFSHEGVIESKWTFITLVVFLWGVAFIFIPDAFKTIENFKVITGTVLEEGNTTESGLGNNNYEVYFIKLANHEQLFGIATNSKMQPILDENFKGVKKGDSVQISYEENWATKQENINLNVGEIVRNEVVLYDNMPVSFWNGRFKIGIISFLIGMTVLVLYIILYRKAKRLITFR